MVTCVVRLASALASWSVAAVAQSQASGYLFNDSHFHLTNYFQEGTNIHNFLNIMGAKVGRVALFGVRGAVVPLACLAWILFGLSVYSLATRSVSSPEWRRARPCCLIRSSRKPIFRSLAGRRLDSSIFRI